MFNAHAFKYKMKRCATWGDSLNQDQAAGRWKWTEKCDENFQALVTQFPQMNPSRYLQDSNGNNRRTYPVYSVINVNLPEEHNGYYTNPKNWFAPSSAPKGNADLESACKKPAGYQIGFICLSSCYTPDMLLSFSSGDVDVESAYLDNLQDILTISPESTIEKMLFEYKPVANHIRSVVDGKHEIIKFLTNSGKILKVTPNHPLIDGKGRMIRADQFKKGDYLVNTEGEREQIVALSQETYKGKVYNVDVNASQYTEKVIVAQGLLSGDLSFQNENTKYLERVLFRMNAVPEKFLRR